MISFRPHRISKARQNRCSIISCLAGGFRKQLTPSTSTPTQQQLTPLDTTAAHAAGVCKQLPPFTTSPMAPCRAGLLQQGNQLLREMFMFFVRPALSVDFCSFVLGSCGVRVGYERGVLFRCKNIVFFQFSLSHALRRPFIKSSIFPFWHMKLFSTRAQP